MIQEFTAEELQSEEWRDVIGFEGYYAVSNLGRVKSVGAWRQRRRVLKPSLNGGYLQVVMSRDGVDTTRKVHGLVAAAFLGACPAGKEPNHIDRCRSNNRVCNLEYLTHQENILHSIIGEQHHLATLTAAEARTIRQMESAGKSPSEIFAKFSHVDRKSVYNVRSGRTWKYLT